jgi:exopolysaccharide biosynthesis polyprenyl glycosylphosphotransferase
MLPLWIIIFILFQLYNPKVLFAGTDEYSRIFNACTMGMMCVIVAVFLTTIQIARAWLILSWLFVTGLVIVSRWVVRRIIRSLRLKGHYLTPVIIVGANEEGHAVAEQLISTPQSGAWVAGFADDHLAVGSEILPGLKVLGDTDNLAQIVRDQGVKELIVASTSQPREKLLRIFREFSNSEDVSIRLSSGLFEMITTGMRVQPFGAVPLMTLDKMRLSSLEFAVKTAMDYIITLLSLIVFLPVMTLIAIAIKLDSPGPIIYRRRVMGLHGKQFDAFKFRTMLPDADKILDENPELKRAFENNFKLKEDPRVTQVGKILRRLSLDEIPQLFNVLRGEMSLIGPRMITAEEHTRYGKWGINLLTVKPALTGLWQISGRSDVSYEERIKIDMAYIRNYSIWLDFYILWQTPIQILFSRGAY